MSTLDAVLAFFVPALVIVIWIALEVWTEWRDRR